MDGQNEVLSALSSELRRGTIVLSVLSQLKEPKYGYALVAVLEEKGMSVEANTLYPLLRRLEKQGLLKSEWDTSEAKPRKYYALTESGWQVYERLKQQWSSIVDGMNNLLDGGGERDE